MAKDPSFVVPSDQARRVVARTAAAWGVDVSRRPAAAPGVVRPRVNAPRRQGLCPPRFSAPRPWVFAV